MEITWWAYIVPLISAALGGIVGLGLERYRSRRRRLGYVLTIEGLVSSAVPLTVLYQDRPVNAPQLVTARFTNLGPQDVTIDDFSGGALGVRVEGAAVIAPVQHTLDDNPLDLDEERTATGLVSIKPTLIPQGSTIELSVLVSGIDAAVSHVIRLRQTTPIDSGAIRMTPDAARSFFREGVLFTALAGLSSIGLFSSLATGNTALTGGPVTTAIFASALAAMVAFVLLRVFPTIWSKLHDDGPRL